MSPVVKIKASTQIKYASKKIKSVQTVFKKKLELITGKPVDEVESDEEQRDYATSEMITQLKDKFKSSKRRREKIQILTVLPRSWSTKTIQSEFEVSNYMVRKAKKLVEDKGILSTPSQKAGRTLTAIIVDNIRKFYCNDLISLLMPGMKDSFSEC